MVSLGKAEGLALEVEALALLLPWRLASGSQCQCCCFHALRELRSC